MHLMLSTTSLSGGALGQAAILLVAGVIFLAFVWWVNNTYVPEPLRKWVILVVVLVVVLLLLNFVLGLGGHPMFTLW